jgi:hypothetical protein
VRFLGLDPGLFLHRLRHRLRGEFPHRRRGPGAEERLRHGQVLLPADLRRRDPGHRLGRHRRARPLRPQLAATFLLVGFVYPFFEGIAWNQAYGIQAWIKASFGEEFHDFAGSVVVHAVGGWVGLAAVLLLGARRGRYHKDGGIAGAHPPSSIPFLALGAWILIVGWFGFNVMSAQTLDKISGLVAMNSLMAMVGGTLAALVAGQATTRASCITARWPDWSPSAPGRTSCTRSVRW